MSAYNTVEYVDAGKRRYTYIMDLPVPSYLLAIVVGNLQMRTSKLITRIISEPTYLVSYT